MLVVPYDDGVVDRERRKVGLASCAVGASYGDWRRVEDVGSDGADSRTLKSYLTRVPAARWIRVY